MWLFMLYEAWNTVLSFSVLHFSSVSDALFDLWGSSSNVTTWLSPKLRTRHSLLCLLLHVVALSGGDFWFVCLCLLICQPNWVFHVVFSYGRWSNSGTECWRGSSAKLGRVCQDNTYITTRFSSIIYSYTSVPQIYDALHLLNTFYVCFLPMIIASYNYTAMRASIVAGTLHRHLGSAMFLLPWRHFIDDVFCDVWGLSSAWMLSFLSSLWF